MKQAFAGAIALGATACGVVPPQDARALSSEQYAWVQHSIERQRVLQPAMEAIWAASRPLYDLTGRELQENNDELIAQASNFPEQIQILLEGGRILTISQDDLEYQAIQERIGSDVAAYAPGSSTHDRDFQKPGKDDYIVVYDMNFPEGSVEDYFSTAVSGGHPPIELACIFAHEFGHHNNFQGHDPAVQAADLAGDPAFYAMAIAARDTAHLMGLTCGLASAPLMDMEQYVIAYRERLAISQAQGDTERIDQMTAQLNDMYTWNNDQWIEYTVTPTSIARDRKLAALGVSPDQYREALRQVPLDVLIPKMMHEAFDEMLEPAEAQREVRSANFGPLR